MGLLSAKNIRRYRRKLSIAFQVKDVHCFQLWKVCANGEQKTVENLFDFLSKGMRGIP